MPDPASLGLGAGGGAGVAAVTWLLDKLYGSGKSVKELRDELKSITEHYLAPTLKKIEEMWTWHNIQDPKDPAGKIWYFSVALRNLLEGVDKNLDVSVDIQKELISRFDRYNDLMEQLAVAVGKLDERIHNLEDAFEDRRKR